MYITHPSVHFVELNFGGSIQNADSVKNKKRFCLSLKMATNFFALATTLKNLGAKWLSGKKKKNSRPKKGFFGVGEVEGES